MEGGRAGWEGTEPDGTPNEALRQRFPRSVATVNLDAIAANVRSLRQAGGPRGQLIAVVKANAYGHGAVPVALTALQAGATLLAVACVDEGVQIRRAGIDVPVLLLGATPPEAMRAVVAADLTPTICDVTAARALQVAVAAAGRPVAGLHVKVDTGLHRFGIAAAEAAAFVGWLSEQPRLRLDGLYTHFSCAEEEDSDCTRDEYGRFVAVVDALHARGVRPPLHAANSAALMRYPALRLNMVRAGLALYGLAGDYDDPAGITQQPALSIHSRVSRVFALAPGEAVGYGQTYRATGPRQVALVGIGYGDGFRRGLGNRGAVLVNGRRAAVLGRVSMDQITVDVTEAGPVAVGDPVTIIGRQGAAEITAAELAGLVDTISYEIVTGLAPRLPRAYLRRGRLVGVSDLLGDHPLTADGDASIFQWAKEPPAAAAR